MEIPSDQLHLFHVKFVKSTERIKWRQQQLRSLFKEGKEHLTEEYLPLEELLVEYQDIFSLE